MLCTDNFICSLRGYIRFVKILFFPLINVYYTIAFLTTLRNLCCKTPMRIVSTLGCARVKKVLMFLNTIGGIVYREEKRGQVLQNVLHPAVKIRDLEEVQGGETKVFIIGAVALATITGNIEVVVAAIVDHAGDTESVVEVAVDIGGIEDVVAAVASHVGDTEVVVAVAVGIGKVESRA